MLLVLGLCAIGKAHSAVCGLARVWSLAVPKLGSFVLQDFLENSFTKTVTDTSFVACG